MTWDELKSALLTERIRVQTVLEEISGEPGPDATPEEIRQARLNWDPKTSPNWYDGYDQALGFVLALLESEGK